MSNPCCQRGGLEWPPPPPPPPPPSSGVLLSPLHLPRLSGGKIGATQLTASSQPSWSLIPSSAKPETSVKSNGGGTPIERGIESQPISAVRAARETQHDSVMKLWGLVRL